VRAALSATASTVFHRLKIPAKGHDVFTGNAIGIFYSGFTIVIEPVGTPDE